MTDPKLNHQIACREVRSSEYPGSFVTFSPIVSPTAVNITEDRFCMVIKRLPAAPWKDLGTLEVMNIEAAAKDMSGPKVHSTIPGKDKAQ